MHVITGARESTDHVDGGFDDADERRQADRAVGVSAVGLALTGLIELAVAVVNRIGGVAR